MYPPVSLVLLVLLFVYLCMLACVSSMEAFVRVGRLQQELDGHAERRHEEEAEAQPDFRHCAS